METLTFERAEESALVDVDFDGVRVVRSVKTRGGRVLVHEDDIVVTLKRGPATDAVNEVLGALCVIHRDAYAQLRRPTLTERVRRWFGGGRPC